MRSMTVFNYLLEATLFGSVLILLMVAVRGLLHDLSKYSPAEFIPSAKNFVGTRSPNEIEREKQGFSYAWMHHKGRNRHHFEYWTDYHPQTKQMMPIMISMSVVKIPPRRRIASMLK